MDDERFSIPEINKHISEGHLAIALIAKRPEYLIPQDICHHFSEVIPEDPMAVSVSEKYGHLVPHFAELGLDFLTDRLEAWEVAIPKSDWLEARIRSIFIETRSYGLNYEGWTWEPREGQPLGATNIEVINNRTP